MAQYLWQSHREREASLLNAKGKVIRCYTTTAKSASASSNSPVVHDEESLTENPSREGQQDGTPSLRQRLEVWQQEHEAAAALDAELAKSSQQMSPFHTFMSSFYERGTLSDPELKGQSEGNLQEFEDESLNVLKQGDLIDVGGKGRPLLGIFIRRFNHQFQFLLIDGHWMHSYYARVHFRIPSFVSRADLSKILLHLPTTEIPDAEVRKPNSFAPEVYQGLGALVFRRMKAFEADAGELYRKNSDVLDRMHDIVAEEKVNTLATLREISARVFSLSDSRCRDSALWAVHRTMAENDIGFQRDDRFQLHVGFYHILSRKTVRHLLLVQNWMHAYREEVVDGKSAPETYPSSMALTRALVQARELILRSRKSRAVVPHGGIEPLSEEDGVRASRWLQYVKDRKIDHPLAGVVEYFKIWAGLALIPYYSPLNVVGSMFLSCLGMYDGFVLDRSTGYLFLQELGVYMPWQSPKELHPRLELPQLPIEYTSTSAQYQKTANQKMEDSMTELRRDWADLEVLCIDDKDARELDDGISVEPDPENGSQWWIHIHVANPTAFMAPDHPAARFAAAMVEARYYPERVCRMLPPLADLRNCSLAPNRPCLTFSALVDNQGQLLSHKITPGFIRNVVRLTPKTVQELLDDDDDGPQPSHFTLEVGSSIASQSAPLEQEALYANKTSYRRLSQTSVASLKLLHRLELARENLDPSRIGPNITRPRPTVSVLMQPHSSLPSKRDHFSTSDPVIRMATMPFALRMDPELLSVVPGTALVPRAMTLAGEIAASWCKDRGIPIPYQGSVADPDQPTHEQFRKEVLDPEVEEHGSLSWLSFTRHRRLMGYGRPSVDPVRHTPLGMDSYAKVTSPLRRYRDMICHWQIEAALRHEAKTGLSLAGNTDTSFLPFQREDVQGIIDHVFDEGNVYKRVQLETTRHWLVQLLARAFYFGETRLPSTWQVYVETSAQNYMHGMIKEMNLSCDIEAEYGSPGYGLVQSGDWWEAKLVSVDTYTEQITLEPVRLIERTATMY